MHWSPIAGYAAHWGVRFRPENVETDIVLRPGCFSMIRSIALRFDHDEGRDFGVTTRIGNLALWQDDIGLAFEAHLPVNRGGASLYNGVVTRAFNEMSVAFEWGFHAVPIDGDAQEITWAALREISITPNGACPGTAAWLRDAEDQDLPLRARALARTWRASRDKIPTPTRASARSTEGPSTCARSRPPHNSAKRLRTPAPLVLGQIDRLIAEGAGLSRRRA
jgi:HK97 family phage prohead protease